MKQYYEALFLSYSRPRTECSISQFCSTKSTHSILRTIVRSTRSLLAKQKSPSIHSQPDLIFAERAVVVFEWTLTELRFNIIKNLLWLFLCLVLVEPKAPCYRAHVCVRNSGFSRILSPTTRDHFRAMFVWFSYPEKTWRRWQLFATIAQCAHITHLVNDVGKFSMFKINLSYFPSRARLNFRWIFKDIWS